MPSQAPQPRRIVISKRTTPERLMEQVAERRGTNFFVVGTGARAKRLINWLAREMAGVIIVPMANGEHTAAVVHPQDEAAIAIGNDQTGSAPTATRIHGTLVNGRS